MIAYSCKLHYKDSTREMKGGFSIQLPDDKSPEELRQYLAICHDAATKSVKSCDIEQNSITGEKKVPLLTTPSSESTFKKNTRGKPPSEKQLSTAQIICEAQGISPKDAAEQYGGVSRLEDLTSQQMWKFINDKKTNQVESFGNSF